MTTSFLDAVNTAVAEGNWHKAVVAMRARRDLLSVSDVSLDPIHAITLAWSSFHGGLGFNRELARLAAPVVRPDARKESDFARRLSDAIFAEGLVCLRAAIRAENSNQIMQWAFSLAMLVGATDEREASLRVHLGVLIELLGVAQNRVLQTVWRGESSGGDDQPTTPPPIARHPLFALPVRLYHGLAQSDFYPELARHLLRQTLLIADWPILQHMDSVLVLLARDHLLEIVNDRSALSDMPEGAALWLRMAVLIDPDPLAPGESDEGSAS